MDEGAGSRRRLPVLGCNPTAALAYLDYRSLGVRAQAALRAACDGGGIAEGCLPVVHFCGRCTQVSGSLLPNDITLIVTNTAILRLNKEGSISRCIPISDISELIISDDYWVGLKVPAHYDMLIRPAAPKDARDLTDVVCKVRSTLGVDALAVRSVKHQQTHIKSLLNMKKPRRYKSPVSVIATEEISFLTKVVDSGLNPISPLSPLSPMSPGFRRASSPASPALSRTVSSGGDSSRAQESLSEASSGVAVTMVLSPRDQVASRREKGASPAYGTANSSAPLPSMPGSNTVHDSNNNSAPLHSVPLHDSTPLSNDSTSNTPLANNAPLHNAHSSSNSAHDNNTSTPLSNNSGPLHNAHSSTTSTPLHSTTPAIPEAAVRVPHTPTHPTDTALERCFYSMPHTPSGCVTQAALLKGLNGAHGVPALSQVTHLSAETLQKHCNALQVGEEASYAQFCSLVGCLAGTATSLLGSPQRQSAFEVALLQKVEGLESALSASRTDLAALSSQVRLREVAGGDADAVQEKPTEEAARMHAFLTKVACPPTECPPIPPPARLSALQVVLVDTQFARHRHLQRLLAARGVTQVRSCVTLADALRSLAGVHVVLLAQTVLTTQGVPSVCRQVRSQPARPLLVGVENTFGGEVGAGAGDVEGGVTMQCFPFLDHVCSAVTLPALVESLCV